MRAPLQFLALAASVALLTHRAVAQDGTSMAATAAADTGRMTPGRVDFSPYETPGACVAATWSVLGSTLVPRTPDALDPQDHDTLQGALETDSLPTAAVDVARRCGAKFTVGGVAPEDLPDLSQLALMMGDSALAVSALTRRLSLAGTVRERADVLMATIEMYRTARPARLGAVPPILAKLDALGAAARDDRIRAHMEIARDLERRFERVGLRREAERVLALYAELSSAEREAMLDTAVSAYFMLTQVQQFEDPKGVYAILDRARADLGTTTRGRLIITPRGKPPFKPGQARMLAGGFTHEWWDANHEEMAIPKAQYWFDREGPSAKRPLPGRMTLFVSDNDESLIWKLHEKYASAGLDLVMEVKTAGYAEVEGQLHVMTPEQEADARRREYIETKHLPVALGIIVTAYTRDSVTGERIDEAVGLPASLLDRDGRYVTSWTQTAEDLARIEAYIDREIARR